MGQQLNKTYKGPDGSIYRVEEDGTLTKIKSGNVSMNEPPSKYQVTSEGEIYRIEADGSVTSLGNINDHNTTPPEDTYLEEPEKNGKTVFKTIMWIVVVAVAVCGLCYYFNDRAGYTAEPAYVESLDEPQVAEAVEPSYSSDAQEVAADDNAIYAFTEDGDFYGTIGNVRIHGNLTLNTENPHGVIYYTDSGDGSALEIVGTADGKIWSEYSNDDNTGNIELDIWDLSRRNFARGTYTRVSDGKRFSIKLYKSNF